MHNLEQADNLESETINDTYGIPSNGEPMPLECQEDSCKISEKVIYTTTHEHTNTSITHACVHTHTRIPTHERKHHKR